MHCFERTLCIFFYIGVVGNVLCQGLPTEGQNTKSFNGSANETDQGVNESSALLSYPSIPIPLETTTEPPDSPRFNPPVHAGPGSYLETRRRQTEGRIQQLERQMNLLLEDQKQRMDPKPEQELAIQHGLNCKRGDTVLVCLMKKVVILRREMSEIRRDVSELGMKIGNNREVNKNETKDTNKDGSTDQEEGKGTEENGPNQHGHESETQLPDTENTTKPILPQYDPLCPPGYDRVGNVCYYVVTDRTGSVSSSRDFCESHGGYLAQPKDSLIIHDLANHLTGIFDTVSELWVDGEYHTEKEIWKWNDGEDIDSSIWGISDTPSKSHRTGTCVLLKKELNYLAMPQDCGYHYFFVCQAETIKDTPTL